MKLRENIISGCAAVLLCIGGIGCNATPVREEERPMLPPRPVGTPTAERRAETLRRVLAPFKVRGIGVIPECYRERFVPEGVDSFRLAPAGEVIGVIRRLGFNRIYCLVSSETQLGKELRALVVDASRAGIPVELMVRQGDFRHRFRGNALIRFLLPQFRRLPDFAEDIVKFNRSLPREARLAGVTVRFEPHLFTLVNGAERIPGLYFLWSDRTFGAGLDNDKLAELSIAVLSEMKKNLDGIPLKVELPDFYPAWVAEGKLTRGRPADFAALDGVLIQCTGNVPSSLVRGYAAGGGKGHIAVIPLAGHTSVRSGALRRRNWNDFVRALEHFAVSSKKMNCSGVVLRPLAELGFMLWEQD